MTIILILAFVIAFLIASLWLAIGSYRKKITELNTEIKQRERENEGLKIEKKNLLARSKIDQNLEYLKPDIVDEQLRIHNDFRD